MLESKCVVTMVLVSVYGMRVVALRRNPKKSEFDPICDEVYGTGKDSLQTLMSISDYVVCSAPSTIETRGMVNADAFKASKPNQVFINMGRGPVGKSKYHGTNFHYFRFQSHQSRPICLCDV